MEAAGMRGRHVATLSVALVMAGVVAPSGEAPHSAFSIHDVTEPSVNPNPARVGDLAIVSFTLQMQNHPPCGVPPTWTPSPACFAVLVWRISLDGDFMSEDATPLAEGRELYHVQSHYEQEGYFTEFEVEEIIMVPPEVGPHTLRVQVDAATAIPVNDISSATISRLLPCGVSDTGIPTDCRGGFRRDTSFEIRPNDIVALPERDPASADA